MNRGIIAAMIAGAAVVAWSQTAIQDGGQTSPLQPSDVPTYETDPTYTASSAASITDAGSGSVITAGERSVVTNALQSGVYTQSWAATISMNIGYKIAAYLAATNSLTLDIADAQPAHPFNLHIHGTNAVTTDANLIQIGDWTQGITNILSFTPGQGVGKWFFTAATP